MRKRINLNSILLVLLVIAAAVNFVGALGPELGFDALWYHLTIPKIYLQWGKIAFIPGGLLYYSAMPRLGELIFYLGKANDTFAHLVSWGAAIGAAVLVYKLARKYLDQKFSLLAALIFYATPLVGWQSGSAYVDLLRTFFEILALYFLINKKFLWAGIAVGLAISTKTLAIGSLGILGVVCFLETRSWKNVAKFLLPAIIISAPWFIWSYKVTGFPFYPIGAGILDASHNIGNIWPPFPPDWWLLIYLLTMPFWPRKSAVFWYAILAYLVWFIMPRTGDERFLLPYLPAFAILAAGAVEKKRVLLIAALVIALVSIVYRGAANARLLPYLLGRETKENYLCRRLDFSTRVFVDCDGWFAKNIKPTDLVLVKGFHNLFYVDFPYVHESWYKGEKVDYVLNYQGDKNGAVYTNNLTGAVVHKL